MHSVLLNMLCCFCLASDVSPADRPWQLPAVRLSPSLPPGHILTCMPPPATWRRERERYSSRERERDYERERPRDRERDYRDRDREHRDRDR
jgi:hypothetical protein